MATAATALHTDSHCPSVLAFAGRVLTLEVQALTMLAQAAVSVDIAGVERVNDGDSHSVVGSSVKSRRVDSPQAFPLTADVHGWCVDATVPTIIDNARSRLASPKCHFGFH